MNRSGFTYHVGAEAGLVLPLEKLAPVNVGEEVVRFDLCGAVSTETTNGITVQQSCEQITGGRWYNVAAREGQRFLQNLAVHLVDVLIVERRQTCQHLVEQDTQSPPINSLGVAIAKQKFGSKVFGSTAEGWSSRLVTRLIVDI